MTISAIHNPDMNAKARAETAKAIARFKAKGGKIELVPTGKSGLPVDHKRKKVGITINPRKAQQ